MRTNAITSDDFLVFFNILCWASFQKSNIEKLTDFLFIFSEKKIAISYFNPNRFEWQRLLSDRLNAIVKINRQITIWSTKISLFDWPFFHWHYSFVWGESSKIYLSPGSCPVHTDSHCFNSIFHISFVHVSILFTRIGILKHGRKIKWSSENCSLQNEI